MLKCPKVLKKLKPRHSVHHIFPRDFCSASGSQRWHGSTRIFREAINISWYISHGSWYTVFISTYRPYRSIFAHLANNKSFALRIQTPRVANPIPTIGLQGRSLLMTYLFIYPRFGKLISWVFMGTPQCSPQMSNVHQNAFSCPMTDPLYVRHIYLLIYY